MGRRALWTVVYGIAFLLLMSVAAWALLSFAMPGDEYVDIGLLSAFPPSAQPYELQDPVHVFVVNDGGDLLVLDPLNRVSGGHVVRWWPGEGYFIDPGQGTYFDLRGRPVALNRGVPGKQGLPRYPVTIRDGRVLVAAERLVIPTSLP
ncbi:MAG: hypothetical protein A2W36_02285 [Chloroflexi bacterium RBG_16_58_14]|nr:MAG: hypothetical protein A2W36_02285 [Chloroflexi bacterium RBG_16_58_14]